MSCIGIDLGTSTTVAAVIKNGRCEILRVKGNSINFDSIVTYSSGGKHVGRPPSIRRNNAAATIFEIKRIIGRKYKEAVKEVEANKWPFTVLEGENGTTAIELEINNRNEIIKQLVTPEQVDADILSIIRDAAEKYLGVPKIDRCIITCPVEFSTEQRRATLSAGYLAGFPNIQLVAEPTAAAIAFAEKFDRDASTPRHYLVYDFGGGTFDASVVYRHENAYRVINTAGDPHLGGKDVDVVLMDYVLGCISRRHLQVKKRKMGDLKIACKEAKELLISEPMYNMELVFCEPMEGYEDNYDENDVPPIGITQRQLATLCKPIILRTIEVVRTVLSTCNPPLSSDDIDKVFLMGGSSNLEAVKDELRNLFRPDQLLEDALLLAKGGIALGAVRIASCTELPKPDNLSFQDVSSHEVRLVCGSTAQIILPQKTPIGEPRSLRILPTDYQKSTARFIFTAGLTDALEDNVHLGTVRIPMDPIRLPEEQPFLVTVKVQSNDLIDVVVTNELVGKGYHFVLNAGLTDTMCKDLKMLYLKKMQVEKEQKLIVDLKSAIHNTCTACLKRLTAEQEEERQHLYDYEYRVDNENLTEEQLREILNRVNSLYNYA